MLLENKRIPFIIAEIGVNHNGCAETAKKLIDAAYSAGVDAVKFQTFKAWECASKFAPTADYQKEIAENQYKLLEGLELDFADFADLKEYAESLGLVFLSTPDGQKSLDFLCDIGVKAIKIASGELTNLPFLTAIAFKKLPVILSTGMGTLGEVEEAINTLKLAGASDIILMHCTTEYPAPAEDCNLKAIQTMQNAFHLPVGFSDHTLGSEAAIAAATLGAVIFEKHITLDKTMEGPDHAASIEPDELKTYVEAIRKTITMLGNGIKIPSKSELKNIPLVRRSLVAAKPIKAGEILTGDKIAIKRPANGIEPKQLINALGRRVLKDLSEDEPITWKDLGEIIEK
ncbi:MAG: N-acetylneuraminate synthase [Candidatus Riflebacteria bacterium]|nr:N-acetylneuraminate synthase [Candidatus Riflebacteria bacterium]